VLFHLFRIQISYYFAAIRQMTAPIFTEQIFMQAAASKHVETCLL